MRVLDQKLEDLLTSLSPLAVDWRDETATKAIAKLTAISKKEIYGRDDIAALLREDFKEGILCCRLFLALSKDAMEVELRKGLPGGGIGVKRFEADRSGYLVYRL